MDLLLIEIDTKLRDIIVANFLPKGLPVYDCGLRDGILGIIDKKKINVVFIDIDKEGGLASNISLLRQIKAKNLAVIAYTEHTDEKELKVLIESGVTGYVKKTQKPAEDVKKLVEIIVKKCPPQERRQAPRVKISEDEDVKVNFNIPNTNKIVKGPVLEISFVGLLFKADLQSDTRNVKPGDLIANMQINLGSKRILTDAQIAMLKGDYIGIKFMPKDDILKNTLIKYMYEKMSAL